ncbi:DUF6318 family protein [Blastococcus mobilis]|uniref:Lipoprotein n=1 Tax=Blastococcus mobilis TaxID=1938746 RepID=A0A238X9V1_9ACTN|nr:DUF6318 family protein [Blastococcus mobilis]SNR55815.1 hypothetical protein SAMN06272737_112111 [Blastococcus mobilis]
MRDLRGSGRLRRTLIGVLLGTALLTGCAEKQEANDTLPSTSASPTTEALPELGPADFPVPDEARTKDAAGAEAFLRYWIDLINRQRTVPAGQPLRDLGPDCNDCWRIANNYDEALAAGRRYDGGKLTLNDVTEPQFTGDEASINFGVRQEAVVMVDAAGTPVDSGLPTQPNLSSGVTLVWSEADISWLVVSMTLG